MCIMLWIHKISSRVLQFLAQFPSKKAEKGEYMLQSHAADAGQR